jgi:TPR repeat protein
MRIIFLLTLIVSSVFTIAETPYQSFTLLNDEESAEVKIMASHESRLLLKQPNNDFIALSPEVQKLFDACKNSHTMLVFTQDIESLISACDSAFSAGSADAAFLVGESLLTAQWTSPDYTKAFAYLEKSSNNGSRSAKRYLISAYQNPRFPINNSSYAYQLAKELAEEGMKWDVMVFSAMQATGANKETAIIGYDAIIELAKEGFQNAYNLAALIKIINGPLQDLEYAQDMLNKPYKKEFYEISFTKVMFSIMKNDMLSAREQLSECYMVNQACALTYVQFLSLGIAGNKDLETAVDILDYVLERSSGEFANDYAWARATATEKPLFNPIAAQKAINNIPAYKKDMPFIIDTIAANYAAKGNFSKAIELQNKALNSLKGKGLGYVYDNMLNHLQNYKENKRWYSTNTVSTYLKKLKNIQNLNHLDAEIAAL